MFENLPPDVKHLIPGAIGSGIAAVFIKDHWGLRIIKAIGGCAVSYYASRPLAVYFGWNSAEGLVGLLTGLFAMTIIAKLWDIIDAVQASEIFVTFRDWLRAKAGLPPKGSQ